MPTRLADCGDNQRSRHRASEFGQRTKTGVRNRLPVGTGYA